jgi:ferritin-like metal-binding protein YciE
MKTLADAFEHTLQDIFYAENQIVKAFPKMASAVASDELKTAFNTHLSETKEQIKLLKDVFKSIGVEAKGEKCHAIEGLLKEGEGLMAEASGVALDVTLLAVAQAVEHYEIARYGSLKEWAKVLGHEDAHNIIGSILDMEKACNSKLTGLAVKSVNKTGGSRKAA